MAVQRAASSTTSPGHKHTARPAASRNQTGQMARKSLRGGKERWRSYSTAFITLIARVCYMARSQWRLLETQTFDRVSDDDITILRHRSASHPPPHTHTDNTRESLVEIKTEHIAGSLSPSESPF